MRHLIRSEDWVPDLVLVSASLRTLDTLKALEPWDEPPVVHVTDALYLASAARMLDVLHKVEDPVRRVLLIGHNPGVQELAVLLAGTPTGPVEARLAQRVAEAYPTGALAEFTLRVPWSRLGPEAGAVRLTRFVTPRELKAAL